jgi:hypothetical protein
MERERSALPLGHEKVDDVFSFIYFFPPLVLSQVHEQGVTIAAEQTEVPPSHRS